MSSSSPRTPNSLPDFEFGPNSETPYLVGIENHPTFSRFDYPEQGAALIAQKALNRLIRDGFINPAIIKSIFEFGTSVGASTLTLCEFAKLCGAEVDGAEYRPRVAEELLAARILPDENFFIGDGIETLNDIAANNYRYDLIAAFMFGALPETRMDFIRSAHNALSEQGKIVIYSDVYTMRDVIDQCELHAINFELIEEDLGSPIIGDIVAIPRQPTTPSLS
jgi:hypothetical protein